MLGPRARVESKHIVLLIGPLLVRPFLTIIQPKSRFYFKIKPPYFWSFIN